MSKYYFKAQVEDVSIDMPYTYSKEKDTVRITARETPVASVNVTNPYERTGDVHYYFQFQIGWYAPDQGLGTFTPRQLFLQGEFTPLKFFYSFHESETFPNEITLTVTKIQQGSEDDPGVLEANFVGTIIKRDPVTQEDIGLVAIEGSFAVPLTGK